jgi:hypothetical protein
MELCIEMGKIIIYIDYRLMINGRVNGKIIYYNT